MDIVFDQGSVLAPDVIWVSEGRLPVEAAYLDFAPELVVEVRSASNWRYDTTVKFRTYEAAGVNEMWLVDTASKSILVYRRSIGSSPRFDIALELAEGEVLITPLLEGFSLDISAVSANNAGHRLAWPSFSFKTRPRDCADDLVFEKE